MNNNLSFSQGAIELLKIFEGFRSKPYPDPASHGKPFTIGYGSTHYEDGTEVSLNDSPITEERAGQILLNYLNTKILPDFRKHITANINQYQIDALAALVYNIGNTGFDNSHVLSDINQGIMNGDLKTRWTAWDKSCGKVLEGLLDRRLKEYNYFETGSIA